MLQTTVILEGNIAADLELTYTTAGKPVVRLPVLVNRRGYPPRPSPPKGTSRKSTGLQNRRWGFGSLRLCQTLAMVR
jgi:hypothetical protein